MTTLLMRTIGPALEARIRSVLHQLHDAYAVEVPGHAGRDHAALD